MNVPHQTINIDINSRVSQNLYLIQNINDNGTRAVDVHLYADSEAFDVSGNTVTATFVTDGFLIAENVFCAVNANVVTVPIDKNNNSISGIMLVELKIFDDNNHVLTTPIAFKVRVTPSITENANVTEQSIGTIADVIKEVAAARGNFNSLSEVFKAKADKATTLAGYGITDAIKNENRVIQWYHIAKEAVNVDILGGKSVTMPKLADDVVEELNKIKSKQIAQYITDTITTIEDLIALNDVNTVYSGVMSGFSTKFGQSSDTVYIGFRMWFVQVSPKQAISYYRIISLSDGTIWIAYSKTATSFTQISYSKGQVDNLMKDKAAIYDVNAALATKMNKSVIEQGVAPMTIDGHTKDDFYALNCRYQKVSDYCDITFTANPKVAIDSPLVFEGLPFVAYNTSILAAYTGKNNPIKIEIANNTSTLTITKISGEAFLPGETTTFSIGHRIKS